MTERCPGCGRLSWDVPSERDLHRIVRGCVLCGGPIYSTDERPSTFWDALTGALRGMRPGNAAYRLRVAWAIIRHHG